MDESRATLHSSCSTHAKPARPSSLVLGIWGKCGEGEGQHEIQNFEPVSVVGYFETWLCCLSMVLFSRRWGDEGYFKE
jgi:hypothetical protein